MGDIRELGLFAAVLAGLLLLQRRGLLVPAFRLAERWRPLRFLTPLRSSVEQIDAEMARVHRESTGQIVLSSMTFALGYACGIVETLLILWFFGIPVSLHLALAVEVLGVMLNNLMFFVPLRAGAQEAGKALVFASWASALRKVWRPVSFIGSVSSPGHSLAWPSWLARVFLFAHFPRPRNLNARQIRRQHGPLPRQESRMSNPLSVSLSSATGTCPVRSFNEWDPLEEVIVGSLDGAVMLSAHITVTRIFPPLGG